MINYGKHEILADDIDAVISVLKSNYLTQGPVVTEFENNFSKFIGAKYAVSVNNATAGLHLAVMAAGIKSGDKILVPAITFAASANCARYVGANVEFLDVDLKNFCLDFEHLEQKINSSPPNTYKALVAVDMAGFPIVDQKLKNLCEQHGIIIIEDACHAIGAKYKESNGWHNSGSCQDSKLAVFSFHPVKHIASGEGGMVVTNDESVAKHLRRLKNHGIEKNRDNLSKYDGDWYMEMQELGFNYRMPDINAALANSQLQRISQNIKNRQNIMKIYREELKNYPLDFQLHDPDKIENAYHLNIALTESRDDLFYHLKKSDIFAQVHYIPIYKHPYYENLYGKMNLKNSEQYYQTALSLPLFHSMTEQELEKIIQSVKSFYE